MESQAIYTVLMLFPRLIYHGLVMVKKYTEEHEWISVENGVGTFGITSHAQSSLGDIVFVEVPGIGDEVKRGGKNKKNIA